MASIMSFRGAGVVLSPPFVEGTNRVFFFFFTSCSSSIAAESCGDAARDFPCVTLGVAGC